jgi:hypothetical protein
MWKKSAASSSDACARRNSCHVGVPRLRRGAGQGPALRPGPWCRRGSRRRRVGRRSRLLSFAPLCGTRVRGPGAIPATRAPKELLHHLPALLLRRPAVSAPPQGGWRRVRGSRLLDRRPPHYRCPAVPGLIPPPGRSRWRSTPPFFPLDQPLTERVLRTAGTAYCWWPAVAPLSGSQPRRPPCACSGLEPHCRTSRYARPQPTPLPRYCSLNFTAGYCEPHLLPALLLRSCSWQPLITAGHPVRSSVPSPPCNRPGSGTPPPHRPAHCTCGYCYPAVRLCRALLISATRETIPTPPPNVYSGYSRFCSVRGGAKLPRAPGSTPFPEAVTAPPPGQSAASRADGIRADNHSGGLRRTTAVAPRSGGLRDDLVGARGWPPPGWRGIGLRERPAGEVALAVSEAASGLVKRRRGRRRRRSAVTSAPLVRHLPDDSTLVIE